MFDFREFVEKALETGEGLSGFNYSYFHAEGLVQYYDRMDEETRNALSMAVGDCLSSSSLEVRLQSLLFFEQRPATVGAQRMLPIARGDRKGFRDCSKNGTSLEWQLLRSIGAQIGSLSGALELCKEELLRPKSQAQGCIVFVFEADAEWVAQHEAKILSANPNCAEIIKYRRSVLKTAPTQGSERSPSAKTQTLDPVKVKAVLPKLQLVREGKLTVGGGPTTDQQWGLSYKNGFFLYHASQAPETITEEQAISILVGRRYAWERETPRPTDPPVAKEPLARVLEAARSGEVRSIIEFLEQGGEVTAKDDEGYSLAYFAACENHPAVLEVLHKFGLDLDAACKYDWPPLLWAISREANLATQKLVSLGASVRHRTKGGSTPLHLAASRGQLNLVKVLMEGGADPIAQDDSGATPLDEALKAAHGEVVSYLRQILQKKPGSKL